MTDRALGDRRQANHRLANWSLLAACAIACATYDAPDLRPGSGQLAGSGGGSGVGGTSGAGGVGTPTSGSPATSGTTSAGGPTNAGTSSNGGDTVQGGTMSGGNAGNAGLAGADAAGAGGEAGTPIAVIDECPNDPAKTSPGQCGCGLPDSDTPQLASCASLKTALLHRYDFEGSGTAVRDRVGTAHGSIKGAATLSQLNGKGVLVLTGGAAGPYVDLPNGIISSLKNATFEAWLTWGGGNAWQRIFDFGDSTSATPEDNPASGKSYLFLTPQIGANAGMRAAYSLTGGTAETQLDAPQPLPKTLTQVVLVVNDASNQLGLFVNGVSVGTQTFDGALASINDVNVWLGRSQYAADDELTATFHDFRIYGAALTAPQIATSFAGGADPAFLLP